MGGPVRNEIVYYGVLGTSVPFPLEGLDSTILLRLPGELQILTLVSKGNQMQRPNTVRRVPARRMDTFTAILGGLNILLQTVLTAVKLLHSLR